MLGHYIDANTSIAHRCLIHNQIWSTTPSRALYGVGCPVCHGDRISRKKTRTHEWYVNEVAKVAPHITVIGKYQNCRTPIKHYCTLHNIEWDASPDNILCGHGCWMCGNDKIKDKNSIPYEDYIKRLKKYNPNIICIGKYVNMTTKVKHRCLIDGYEWDSVPAWVLCGRGCPVCSESHGEREIRNWLSEHSIRFITQKRYNDCIDERELPFDFYLPDQNVLIEYDGEQHYRPVDFFGGIPAFERLRRHDRIKTDYCKCNKIDLIRIPYYSDVSTELNNYILTQ